MFSYSLSKKSPFRILQLTDLHLTHGMKEDVETFTMIQDLVEYANPDLLVLTGDVFTDNDDFHPEEMKFACSEFDSFGIPWAMAMGNHEGNYRQGRGVREKKGEFILKNSKNAIFDPGPESVFGVGNYTIGIQDINGRLLWTLFILDSNNRAYYVVDGKEKTCEDHIRHNQIMWYRQTSDAIKNVYGDIPALAFFHIPIPEFTDAWLFEHCLGDRFEHVTSATVNSGFFSAALGQGDIKGIFVGHDHTNSYSADVFGIKLAYGRCTSYHCNLGDFPRGGRVILLNDKVFETYNLLHLRPKNRAEDNIAVYRQEETLSDPYYNRFNFCLPLNK